MTDQRYLARAVYGKLYIDERGDVTHVEHDLDVIAAALADAERRVWEEAAKGLENHVVYAPSDEAYDNEVGKDGDGTSYNQGVRAAIAWIRAQATQEEG